MYWSRISKSYFTPEVQIQAGNIKKLLNREAASLTHTQVVHLENLGYMLQLQTTNFLSHVSKSFS